MALAPPAATRGPGDTDFPAGIELPGQGDDRHRRHPELDVRPAAETAAAAAAAAAATDALGLAGDESRSFVVDNPAMEDPANGGGSHNPRRRSSNASNASSNAARSSASSHASSASPRRSTRRRSIVRNVSFPEHDPDTACARACPWLQRVLCNSLVAPDDLILREEREQLKAHTQRDEGSAPPDRADKIAACLVEVFLGLGGWKLPAYGPFCAGAPQRLKPSARGALALALAYRAYQLTLIGLMIYAVVAPSFAELACAKSFPVFAATAGSTCLAPFSCPRVQDHLRAVAAAGEARAAITAINASAAGGASARGGGAADRTYAYPGMRATMWALSSASDVFAGGRYFGERRPFSQVFGNVSADAALDPVLVNDYLEWRAETGSAAPHVLFAVFWCACALFLTVSFLVFSVRFAKDDPAELLFPPMLEIKHNHAGSDAGRYASFHFVRPKRLAWHTLACGGLLMFVLGWFLPAFPKPMLVFMPGVGVALLVMPMGLSIQVHNATMLANILARYCSPVGSVRQFEKWKEYYKATVGALHVWSWRMTPITGSMVLVLLVGITRFVVELVFFYTTVMNEPDIAPDARFRVFWSAARAHVQLLIGFTVFLLIFTAAMGMVASRFKMVHVLLATVRLEHHGQVDFDELSILQEHKAALTVWDVPVKPDALVLLYRLLFIEVGLLAVSAAGLL